MTESFRDVVAYAESHKVNNQIAAYMLAIRTDVAEALHDPRQTSMVLPKY